VASPESISLDCGYGFGARRFAAIRNDAAYDSNFEITRLQRIPVDLIHLLVIRRLNPRIHHLRKIHAKRMDPRVKPAGDGSGWARAPIQINPEPL